jgi:excinuclease ABC subunit B
MFDINSQFKPSGDQPQAIEGLVKGLEFGLKNQVLLGVTGSGKTFTMANVIRETQMPTLLISHNKTLAGQLYQEMRDFFPNSGVSYFVSYYDYYQPEAYIPATDTYIEKEADINQVIDMLRLQSTTNILTRKDVIVVASVSCIYNIGSPKEYANRFVEINLGDIYDAKGLALQLVQLLYDRSEFEFKRGTFRIRGDYMDIYPAYLEYGIRLKSESARITSIVKFDALTGEEQEVLGDKIVIYPTKQYITDRKALEAAEKDIKHDLEKEYTELKNRGKLVEAERLLRKVNYDMEMLKEVGYVNGVENYSRYFDGRKPGDPPYSLIDYFRLAYGDKFMTIIDESHMTVPQIGGMYNGDQARKRTLIDFGFRLNSALDNRPMKFNEFYNATSNLVYVSATPDEWEVDMAHQEVKAKKFPAHEGVVEQLIRPTGIIDPEITIRPAKTEIPDLIEEVVKRADRKEKSLVTTLTKKTAEDLTEYLKEREIRAAYLHSDIHTLERSDVLDNLRKGEFDVLIGVNLLREGLDLPEVTLVAILDADKEGFLRSRTSLIQTMGRAARNVDGQVILYADQTTKSMEKAIDEIGRRREIQRAYNKEHNINPKTIYKKIRDKIAEEHEEYMMFDRRNVEITPKQIESIDVNSLTSYDKKKIVKKLEREMKKQAEDMNFELAIQLRDKIKDLKRE